MRPRFSNSVFFRTYVGIGVLTLFALYATHTILNMSIERDFERQMTRSYILHASNLQIRMKFLPEESWQEIVERETCGGFCQASLLSEREILEKYPDLLLEENGNTHHSNDGDMGFFRIEQIPGTSRYLELSDFQYIDDEFISDESLPYDVEPIGIDIKYYWLEKFMPMGIVLLGMAFGMLLLAYQISRPIRHLAAVADKLGKGELDVSVRTDFPMPIQTLAVSFNGMAKELKERISTQQILIGAVPHELRTPLSRIRFALDTSQAIESESELRQHLLLIDRFADELESTVDDAIAITRLTRNEPIETNSVDLKAIIQSAIEKYQHLEGKRVRAGRLADIVVDANCSLIKRALENVIENAVRYALEEITISTMLADGMVCIIIDDDGVGIPKVRRAEVFQPFSRLEESRARKSGGAGLGLALVQLVMSKHDGTVSVHQSASGGARFILSWPCRTAKP